MLKNIRYQTKFLLFFSVLIIFIVIVICLFIYSFVFKIFEKRIINDSIQLSQKFSQQVDAYINELIQISRNFINDKNILKIIKDVNMS